MKKQRARMLTFIFVLIMLVGAVPIAALAASSGSSAGIVSVSTGSLNVRSSASVTSNILTRLPKGSYVTLISKSGSWWRVEYGKGQYGYCSAQYISQVSGSYAAYTDGSLNIRSGPGTSYGVIGWLNKGEYAVVLPGSGNWKKILFAGTRIGYVNGAYLKTNSGYSAVSLSVPNYKQTDPRWSNTKLGTSGKTIASDGCLTTALAMTESYRTGTAVTPNVMASRLKYTSGGAAYWPSNYTAYTQSDYLKMTYNLLKSGKPVLLGLKNASGGQHWSVVTGFTGGQALSASGFTVNDPGSSSKTTLQQVVNDYPYFYKIMYY